MKDKIGKNVLATCSAWFCAPDGKEYKAIHGTLKAIHTSESTLGFTPSRTHTNWYFEIGNIIIAGCQILYLIESENVNMERVMNWHSDVSGIKEFERPCIIYNANANTEQTQGGQAEGAQEQ